MGPTFALPTATSSVTGQGKFSIGPSVVVLAQPGKWTVGVLVNSGNDTTGGNVWVVPFGGGIGQVRRLGFQPINWTVQFYGNAVHPQNASPWSFKLQIALLYPKMPKRNWP